MLSSINLLSPFYGCYLVQNPIIKLLSSYVAPLKSGASWRPLAKLLPLYGLWAVLLFLAWPTTSYPAYAQTALNKITGPIMAEVTCVKDGDTLCVRAYIWPGHQVETVIRLAGIDAPEKRGACADERLKAAAATAQLEAWVGGAKITLTDIQPDKYAGRYDAKVWRDGREIGAALIAAKLARPYDGGKRQGWCELQ
jgi:micrococcal nuclease